MHIKPKEINRREYEEEEYSQSYSRKPINFQL